MNQIFTNKKVLILIISLIFVLLLLVVFKLSSTQPSTKSIKPTATQTPLSSSKLKATTTPKPQEAYNKELLDKDYQRIESNKELSTPDQSAREKLINTLGNKSGILSKTSSYNLEYVKAADQFMAELLIEDTEKAKTDAENWLISQGLSSQGVCNLPLVFYLNFEIQQKIANNKKEFNPIPHGC